MNTKMARVVPVKREKTGKDGKTKQYQDYSIVIAQGEGEEPIVVRRKWYVVDARDLVLGRVASQVAMILRGKNKPIYTPHCDTGDNVIIVNADKIKLTGKKLDQKIYFHHSGYPGGLKETPYRKLLADKPEFAVRHAIVGMLPKGPLGREMARKLHVYAGAEHPHTAQQPESIILSL